MTRYRLPASTGVGIGLTLALGLGATFWPAKHNAQNDVQNYSIAGDAAYAAVPDADSNNVGNPNKSNKDTGVGGDDDMNSLLRSAVCRWIDTSNRLQDDAREAKSAGDASWTSIYGDAVRLLRRAYEIQTIGDAKGLGADVELQKILQNYEKMLEQGDEHLADDKETMDSVAQTCMFLRDYSQARKYYIVLIELLDVSHPKTEKERDRDTLLCGNALKCIAHCNNELAKVQK